MFTIDTPYTYSIDSAILWLCMYAWVDVTIVLCDSGKLYKHETASNGWSHISDELSSSP